MHLDRSCTACAPIQLCHAYTDEQTLLTAIARAFTLSTPPQGSDLHATQEELDEIKPLPAPVEKGKRKPKVEPDPVREQVEAKCVHANAIVRRVYVRHPNFDDLLRGLLQGGLDELDTRVPLSVGTSASDHCSLANKQAFLYLPCWGRLHDLWARCSLVLEIFSSLRKRSWMVNEYRFMRARMDRRAVMMVGERGSKARMDIKSGFACSVGECLHLVQ